MKKLLLLAVAAGAIAAPAATSAQVFVRSPGSTIVTGGGFHFPRFDRGRFFDGGFVVGGFFFQPQFQVQNWQLYGLAQPGPHRWIRYYDDALLIDRRGRVRDFRERVAWDRHGERWGYDGRGIPYYVGRGDYHPDERDYERVERERYGRGRGGWDYSDYGRGSYGGGHGTYGGGHGAYSGGHGYAPAPRTGCGPQPCVGYGAPGYNMQGYGYGGGYGGGYYMAPVVITETVVTPAATTMVTEEVVEEVVYEHRPVRRARAHRPRAARPCNCPRPRAPAPRHPPGERG